MLHIDSFNPRFRLAWVAVANVSTAPLGLKKEDGIILGGVRLVRYEHITMTNGGAPRWEPLARLAIRLNQQEPRSADDAARRARAVAEELCEAARFNDILLREALAVFVAGAERGRIGARAADSLRLAIRECDGKKTPFRGVRLRGRRRPGVDRSQL